MVASPADEASLLPLYVAADPRDGGPDGHDDGDRYHVLDVLASAGRVATAVAERWAERADPVPEAAAPLAQTEVHRRTGFSISRHVLAHPGDATRAFDAWLSETKGYVNTPAGRLRPSERPVVHQRDQLRVVPASLRMHGSPTPVPLDLELVPWGTYRAVLNLNLARRLVSTMGWHRRAAYFDAGHAVLEQVRLRIEAAIAEPARHER